MKTAVCIAGYFDSLNDNTSKGIDGFEHLKKHVFSKSDVDVFIHSWDEVNRERILELYGNKVKAFKFEPQIDFRPLETVPPKGSYAPQSRIFSQLYSVQESFRLLREHPSQNYDCVIKTRFDVGRVNRATAGPQNPRHPYAVQCINFNTSLDMNKFYLAKWAQRTFDEEGPADMWFYSNYNNMLSFSRIYDIILRDMVKGGEMEKWAGEEHGGLVNVIKCYKWFLLKTGLWNKKKALETKWE